MRSRLTGVLLAALTLFATVLAGSASADTKITNGGDTHTATDNHHHRWTKLALTVRGPRDRGGETVLLECQPARGTHPHPKRACLELKVARGNFDHLPGNPELAACTMDFRPVVASVRGLWRGEWVSWQHRYPNPCTMRAETGVVFDF
jgi:subtilisin inhibitor-like